MTQIFISHSSLDNAAATRIQAWLAAQGWGRGQIFLDLEELTTGDRWRERLNHIGATCEAVVVCLSDNWIRSPECVREFTHAESRGKPIFPVQVAPITEKIPSFIRDLQIATAGSGGEDDGLEQLRAGLLAARIGPEYFRFPPAGEEDRSPYRGLNPLVEVDAAVFFGRDAAISRGLDALRRMRDGCSERILVVLGASGAGKSSFLRAGMLSRLAREELGFSVLSLLRPEDAALTGEHGLLACLGLDAAGVVTTDAVMTRIDDLHSAADAHATAISGSEADARSPTLVVPIDQGEEFFGPANGEGEAALRLLCEVLRADDNTIAVVTIRSDSYERLQAELQRQRVEPLLFDLPLMSPGAFKEVIEGPGRLMDPAIEFDAELSERLIEDLESAAALPLLALTLERLVNHWADDHRLELTEYTEQMGGLSGAIEGAVEAALIEAARRPALPDDRNDLEELARRTFIPWLVQLDGGATAPKRRRAHRDQLPPDVQGLIDCLIDQRLLVAGGRDVGGVNGPFVEVTHEAVLRYWPLLGRWLEAEASNLRLLDNVRSAAQDWLSNEQAPDWLVHSGRRLASAESLLLNPLYSRALPPLCGTYLTTCKEHQPDNDVEEFEKKMALVRQELGDDIFERLEDLDGEREYVKNSGVTVSAAAGGIEDDLQVRKNKLLDRPRWHPKPPDHVGNASSGGDYAEVWQFPCCKKILKQDAEPSQERADGCKQLPTEAWRAAR